jgi:hypothetical protein
LSTVKEIEIVDGKTLKLNNVLSKETGTLDGDEFAKTMHMFEAYTKSKKLTPYGPMVLFSKTAFDGMKMTQRSKLMAQLREVHDSPDAPYSFDRLVKADNCVLARYRGAAAGLQVAYSKIQVYAFEHDIRLKGETYTVIIEQKDGEILADVFTEKAL